jgi:hypothetical protein
MIFQPVPPKDYYSSIRITVTYDDGSTDRGAGFFVKHLDRRWLLTCKHVLSPRYRNPTDSRQLNSLTIDFFVTVPIGTMGVLPYPQKLSINNPAVFFAENDLDLAAICISDWQASRRPENQIEISSHELATQSELSNYQAGIPNYFVGYPNNSPTRTIVIAESEIPLTFPFLRQGIFAAPPTFTFAVKGVLGGERYSWLDSFAISGFSGSPIFVPQFGFSDDEEGKLFTKGGKARKLVGMICGHFEIGHIEERAHTGLSYFVNSPQLLDVIQFAESQIELNN